MATDVAARGLHVPFVDNVVHFQVPRTPELYLHRIGRSARLSTTGHSMSIVGPEEVKDFKRIVAALKAELSVYKPLRSEMAQS